MNKIDFTQTGGFPFDQSTLGFMQDNILLAGQIASLGGSLCIISGCVEAGQSVSAGYVAINGEVLEFKTGTKSASVVIAEETESLQYFDNLQPKPVKKKRYACFGTSADTSNNYPWANFTRYTLASLAQSIANITLESLGILHRACIDIGDIAGSINSQYVNTMDITTNIETGLFNDELLQISFGKTLPTDQYLVLTSFLSKDPNYHHDLYTTNCVIRDRDVNGFRIGIREYRGIFQQLSLMYMIIKL